MTYSIIYPDPPWLYSDKCNAGKRGAEFKYPVMRPEDICALPVQAIAAKDSVLFLWTTGPMFPVAIDVMRAWGFTYKNVAFTWIKTNKDGSPYMGMGHYTRSNAEYCLLGRQGAMLERESRSVSSVIFAPRGVHSAKPPEVRDRIVELYGDIPRIELFARDKVPGWDAWGLDVDWDNPGRDCLPLPGRRNVA